MKLCINNFNPYSNSGPNKFTRQLINKMIEDKDVTIEPNAAYADAVFALISLAQNKIKPILLRLDGIYFNSDQDYTKQNSPIKYAYSQSDIVVFQSDFNKKLTETWFGEHHNSVVIRNAADEKLIQASNPSYFNMIIPKDAEVWSCASSWRPHKRLNDNLRYFLENAPKDAYFVIAGGGANQDDFRGMTGFDYSRVKYLKELDYMSLLSLYRRSTKFIHLAYLDHCPNVVVDAQAAGCHVVCSSTGGTKEIVTNGTIIQEDDWDFTPTKLYEPPKLDFSNFTKAEKKELLSFDQTVSKYYESLRSII